MNSRIVQRMLIIVVFSVSAIGLRASPIFEFIYVDKPGTGWHLQPEAKAALEEVGQKISSWLPSHYGRVRLRVESLQGDTGYKMAHCISPNPQFPFFSHTDLARVLLGLSDGDDQEYHAYLAVDFREEFRYTASAIPATAAVEF